MFVSRQQRPSFHRAIALLLALMLLPPTAAAASHIVLDGPKDLVALMTPHLPEEAPTPQRLQAMLAEMLATEGYFSPTFTVSEEDGARHVHFDPGPRTKVAEVDVTIDGPLAAERRKNLIDHWALPTGHPFRQQDWSDAKQQVLSRLLSVAHADARLVDSEAAIDPEQGQAQLKAHYDAGPAYRFGALRVTGLYRYPDSLVARYNRSIKAGDPYEEDKLAQLQSALTATPYFASARVSLDRDDAVVGDDGVRTAPVNVDIDERAAHRLGFGGGFSSNTGARVEASYHTPNLFNQAWSLDSGVRIEQKQQTAYADVSLPPDERNRRHGFGVLVEKTDIQGLRVDRESIGVQTTQQRGSVEQRLSLNWEHERERPDGGSWQTNRALVPNVQWIWRHVDNLLDPRQGVVLQTQIGGASKAVLSDQNFVRLYARWLQYFPLGARDTLATRMEGGATLAPSSDGIPQDYLFRAGGTGSVRGYSFQSLGVKEGTATVGGRYLAIASIEATHWLTPSWGVATFIDAGDAADSVGALHLAVGYGLGARWKSPAGPIGVDVAYGERTGDLHLHFALAIPF